MPRSLVERTFPDGLAIPMNPQGCETSARAAASNAALDVTLGARVCHPGHCEDVPHLRLSHQDAIRQAAERNGLPVDASTPVSVLIPYFYNT